jgi:hypothetical protein
MPPIIFIIGFVGDIFGLLVLLKKNLAKIGPRGMYRFLFVMDLINLLSITVLYLNTAFKYDLLIISKYGCKLFVYIAIRLGSIPSYILIYISVEKIIATKYPTRKYFLRKKESQIIYFLIILAFNSVYSLITLFVSDIIRIPINNTTTTISVCAFIDDYVLFAAFNWMDIVNRLIIPTILMILSSIIFLNSIWSLNQRIALNFRTNQNLRKQINRIISLLILNVSYIIFPLPISIVAFFYTPKDIEFIASFYFKMIAYSINFYLILLTNSLFRKEFLSFLN